MQDQVWTDEHLQRHQQRLEQLSALGVPPYPTRFDRTDLAADVLARFETAPGETVRIAGRVVGGKRDLGKAGFVHLLDQSGRIQVYFRRDALSERDFELFKLLGVGDFIGVVGPTFRTRAGEITVEAREVHFLAPALRPLPDKWHGLQDPEVRYRQRYLDLITNPESRQVFLLRSRALRALRQFLDERGFVEVETPVLQPVAGGGAARPFKTFYEALDRELYLRIALELYLKRCIIGGIERVYEVGKNFRNEGMSRKHNPEFTMLELYQAYADYGQIMELTEQLVATMAVATLGTTKIPYGDDRLDLTPPWRRLALLDAIAEFSGLDVRPMLGDPEALRAAAAEAGLAVEAGWGVGKVLDELLTAFVEPRLVQPTFLVDYPVEFPGSTLAKRKPDDPGFVERFEAFAGGMEIANAFSELNDPLDQRTRFEEQARARQAGDQEAQPFDADFLLALEHGMPPTGGMGLGIDRVIMLLTNRRTIREVILFPQLRSP